MVPIRTIAVFLLLLISTTAFSRVDAIDGDASLLQQIKKQAQPIKTLGQSADVSDLNALGIAIGDARIVGLGEASHGSHELSMLKQRIFEYLVRYKGFSVLAVEGDWSNWQAINAYVQGGHGNATDLLAQQDFSIYRTQEMRDLIEWMRAYNMTPGSHPNVSITGIDFQEPAQTLSIVTSYVKANVPQLSVTLRSDVACYGKTPGNGGKTVLTAQLEACSTDLERITAQIASQHPAAHDTAERAQALAAIKILEQSAPVMANSADPLTTRDGVLAENLRYIADDMYSGQKIAIWAHDGHVATSFRWKTMGVRLRQVYSDKYFAIGTLFDSGTLSAKPKSGIDVSPTAIDIPDDLKNSTSKVFSQIGAPFFVVLRDVPKGTAFERWLSHPQTLWLFGGVIDPRDVEPYGLGTMNLKKSFDALFFVPTTHATRPLPG